MPTPLRAHVGNAGAPHPAVTGTRRLPAKLDTHGNATGRISHITTQDNSKS